MIREPVLGKYKHRLEIENLGGRLIFIDIEIEYSKDERVSFGNYIFKISDVESGCDIKSTDYLRFLIHEFVENSKQIWEQKLKFDKFKI